MPRWIWWWWNEHTVSPLARLVGPPRECQRTWWTSHQDARVVQPGHWQCPSRARIARRSSLVYVRCVCPTSSGTPSASSTRRVTSQSHINRSSSEGGTTVPSSSSANATGATGTVPAPTASPTAQAQAFACDETDPTNVCHGVVKATVYIDYRCNRIYNPTVDTLLPDVDVQVRLDDGRTLTGRTDTYGEALIEGVQVTRSHPATASVAKPTPPPWVVESGLMLVPCGNSPATYTLTDDSFAPEGRTNVAFRFTVR